VGPLCAPSSPIPWRVSRPRWSCGIVSLCKMTLHCVDGAKLSEAKTSAILGHEGIPGEVIMKLKVGHPMLSLAAHVETTLQPLEGSHSFMPLERKILE
jgi:hypothetical protein